MEVDQLTDEQIANLTPEQIEILENDPGRLAEILGVQKAPEEEAHEEPKQAFKDAAESGDAISDTGEDEPVVLNKSGKGIIPYKKHKELRVENSALREQLQSAQSKLQELLKQKEDAKGADVAEADDALGAHLEGLKEEMPELHKMLSAVLEGSRKQSEKLEQTLQELKREKDESERANQVSIAEQVAEAKDNNPDLVHWESNDPEAWDEALKQDEILRTNAKWAVKPFSERFQEVVRRVRAVMPEASTLKKTADPEKTKADARERLETAPVRRPVTLSDIQGGANPASEREQLENLSPFELAQKLMKMPTHQAAALRAELD
jgi:chromosome segregation ATPase